MEFVNLSKVTASYKILKETKVVAITLTYQERLRKTLGVTPVTLYTPHLILNLGSNPYKINTSQNCMKKESDLLLFDNITTL